MNNRCVKLLIVWACALSALVITSNSYAEITNITVRVLSRDAKFIGSSMGGVRVVIRDELSGAILSEGVTRGSTGNTRSVMHRDGGRRARLTNNDAASFETSVDLSEPRRLSVEAYGPMGQTQAANKVSATQWVVPGKHLDGGDGWVLEMPGFAVDILWPPAHSSVEGAQTDAHIRANVVMMCGCPIEPDGLWDAKRFEVAAWVLRDGDYIGTFPLKFAGATSQFEVVLPLTSAGTYDVTVYAHDPVNGNTGVDRTTFFAY